MRNSGPFLHIWCSIDSPNPPCGSGDRLGPRRTVQSSLCVKCDCRRSHDTSVGISVRSRCLRDPISHIGYTWSLPLVHGLTTELDVCQCSRIYMECLVVEVIINILLRNRVKHFGPSQSTWWPSWLSSVIISPVESHCSHMSIRVIYGTLWTHRVTKVMIWWDSNLCLFPSEHPGYVPSLGRRVLHNWKLLNNDACANTHGLLTLSS